MDRQFDNLAEILIRPLAKTDLDEWLRMRLALWPEDTADELRADCDEWLARTDTVVLIAERADGSICGFAEVGSRPYADGCDTSPVAYLEGWYVDPDVRRMGVGGALVHFAEEWARAHGYRELASDALLENVVSQQSHLALGFAEVDRAVRYRKSL